MNTPRTTQAENAAFKRAQSHSRRVIWVKRILPVFAVCGLAAGGLYIYAAENAPDISVDLPDSTIADGKLVMANPKLDGFTSDRKPYRVTANRAIQDLTGDTAIQLEVLRADVELRDGNKARLTSPTGTFDSNTSILILPEEAVLTMSDGMRAVFGRADVNIQSGAVLATNNVHVKSEEADITSVSMQIIDNGKQIVFEDQVRVVLTPKSDQPAASAAQTQ